MLLPKRTKFRKQMKGRNRGLANRGNKVSFGEYGLQSAHDIPTASEQGYDVVWRILRGFYVGRDVSNEAYGFWVDAFDKMFGTIEFASLQRELGLFPFNRSGASVEAEIVEEVGQMRQLAIDMGLLQ